MKKIVLFLFLFLTGCATQDDVFQGRAHMNVRQEPSLNGLSMRKIEKKLGTPVAKRLEEPNFLWTYRYEDCTTLVYFNKKKRVSYAETRGICSHYLTAD